MREERRREKPLAVVARLQPATKEVGAGPVNEVNMTAVKGLITNLISTINLLSIVRILNTLSYSIIYTYNITKVRIATIIILEQSRTINLIKVDRWLV